MTAFKQIFSFCLFFIVSILAKEKQDIVICSMFQNEGRFLKEWIEYHKLIGVSHFYLYNNNSCDHYLEILTPYIEKGEVTLKDWNYPIQNQADILRVQESAFMDGVIACRKTAKWAAFIDIDEFIVPVEKMTLQEALKEFEKASALAMSWVTFGTSHVDKIPENQLMIEALTKRAYFSHERNKGYKTIVRPEFVEKTRTSHAFFLKKNAKGKTLYTVNEKWEKIRDLFINEPSFNKIRLNHYLTRDIDFFENEKIDRLKKRHPGINLKLLLDELNKEEDRTILKFSEALRKNLH